MRTTPRIALATFFALSTITLWSTPARAGGVYKKMFVTSTTGSGDLSSWVENTTPPSGLTGVAAGDHICQDRAEAAGLATKGTPVFRAWLSDTATDAWCHVQGLTGKVGTIPPCDGGLIGGGPWMRVDGQPFSQDVDRLIAEGALLPAEIDETGSSIGIASPWTGTYTIGVAKEERCGDWDSTAGSGAIGRSYDVLNWSYSGTGACDGDQRLHCFEQGAGPALPAQANDGALMFVTQTAFDGGFLLPPSVQEGGSASAGSMASGVGVDLGPADAICQGAAAAGFLPNPESFYAWLSTSVGDAIERVGGGGPWKALDGYPIAASKADLTDGSIAYAVRLSEHAVRGPNYYWTGSTLAGTYDGSLDTTCQNWMDTQPSDYGTVGTAGANDDGWTTDVGSRCDFVLPSLLCMSDIVLLGWDNFETGDFRRWQAVGGGP